MEQARFFIAIALSILVFILWEAFFVPKIPIPEKVASETTQVIPPGTQNLSSPDSTNLLTRNTVNTDKENLIENTLPSIPNRPPKSITVSTNLYTSELCELGGLIKSFQLKEYKENLSDANLKEMVNIQLNKGTLILNTLNNSIPGLSDAFFELSTSETNINIDSPKELSFQWTSPNGIKIIKQFIFYPDTYVFDYNINIQNYSNTTIDDSLKITIFNTLPKQRGYAFEGPCALIDDKLQEVKIKKIKDKNIYGGNLSWVATQDRYFLSSIIPVDNANSSMHLNNNDIQLPNKLNELEHFDLIETNLVKMMSSLQPGSSEIYNFKIYIGPKCVKVLKHTGYNLDKAVNFGWFDFIAKPCLWLMNKFHDIIPNYGIAIIVLTFLIKILFWPLGTKSYRSMNEMKKLQPLMAEIREKYKNDSQKMNQEIMALYKTYKVNPLGGCLPMVAQMPIFFALYRMLYSAIELRHAPFFGWITDLSAPDRLFDFGITLPFFEPPTGIPVLTLIMGATMFLQQKMAPPAGDPQQAKMMMMMPLFMTIIFINFSSGLVLYWLINNILSIAQQYIITKQIEK